MAIAIGGHDHKQGTASSTTLSTTGVTTQASGSTFLIGVVAAGISNIVAVVDSKLNVYTQIGTQFNTAFGSCMAWYYKENGIGGASHTITSTLGTGQVQTIYFVEITGAVTSSALDQSVAFVGDASSPFTTNTTGTTTQANEIAIAFYGTDTPSGTETITWGAGFTQIDADGNSNFVTGGIGFKVLSATGTVQGSITSSVATDTAGAVLTFKAASGGTTLAPTPGSVGITGNIPGLVKLLVPSSGSVVISGNTPALSLSLGPATGSVVITGNTPSLSLSLVPTAGSVVITGQVPTVNNTGSTILTPAEGQVIITGNAPTITLTIVIPASGQVIISGNAPSINPAPPGVDDQRRTMFPARHVRKRLIRRGR